MGEDIACAVSGCLLRFGDFGKVGVPAISKIEYPCFSSLYHSIPVYWRLITPLVFATGAHSWTS